MLKDISRTAVDGYLKVVRKPVDAVLSRGKSDRSKALSVKLDRVDAAARSAAGTALRNPDLKDDAQRRREAAGERERAQRLRGVATEHAEKAEAQSAAVQEEAEQRRRKAAEQTERRKQQAQKRKAAARKKAAEASSERKQSAKKAAAETKAESAKQTKREQLAQLEAKEAALEKKEAAVNSAAESRRLAEAASEAKAKRKNGS